LASASKNDDLCAGRFFVLAGSHPRQEERGYEIASDQDCEGANDVEVKQCRMDPLRPRGDQMKRGQHGDNPDRPIAPDTWDDCREVEKKQRPTVIEEPCLC
jgi:hypothetical protein